MNKSFERKELQIVSVDVRPALSRTTWEQRQDMSIKQLIAAMGPLWVGHPDFKPKARSLLPLPNLAGVQPLVSVNDYGLLASLKKFFRWSLQ